jgi:hypothetical protein
MSADERLEPLPGPVDEADAERMERKARDAERRIDENHRREDPDEAPIYEE